MLDEKIKNMPLIFKILIGAIPLLGVLIWFVSMQISGARYKEQFFREEITSIVVSSNSYYGRSVQFHLKNGFRIYFMPPVGNKIAISDSIFKKNNTYSYNVYRKNTNNVYEFFAIYDFERIQ